MEEEVKEGEVVEGEVVEGEMEVEGGGEGQRGKNGKSPRK